MPYSPDMRASDGDREKIASRLRDAHADGRISVEEFQSRLDALYEARTYGEMEPLVRDLPVVRTTQYAPKPAPEASPPVRRRSRGDKAMTVMWAIWACAVSINLVVWVLVSVTQGFTYFWPAWVAGPWGAALLSVEVIRRAVRD